MSMCRVIFCVVGRGCLLCPVSSLSKTLVGFAWLHFVLQGQTCLLFWVSLNFLLLLSSPLWWKGHLFLVLFLEGLVGLHRAIQLQLLQHLYLGHKVGLLNKPRSFCCFWDCTEYCISGCFADSEGYSISSKGFLLTLVDIMVIWVKVTNSSPF